MTRLWSHSALGVVYNPRNLGRRHSQLQDAHAPSRCVFTAPPNRTSTLVHGGSPRIVPLLHAACWAKDAQSEEVTCG